MAFRVAQGYRPATMLGSSDEAIHVRSPAGAWCVATSHPTLRSLRVARELQERLPMRFTRA